MPLTGYTWSKTKILIQASNIQIFMNFVCYPLMATKSKRLMHKRYKGKRNGQRLNYKYCPQQRLIARLASQLRMTEVGVIEQNS